MVETLNCTNIKLQKGDKGSNVTLLQKLLRQLGYYLKSGEKNLVVDGNYGEYTKTAVKNFQKDKNLYVDGWVGTETCKKINELINKTTNNASSSTTSSKSSKEINAALVPFW